MLVTNDNMNSKQFSRPSIEAGAETGAEHNTTDDIGGEGAPVLPVEVIRAILDLLDNRHLRTLIFDLNPHIWRPAAKTLWDLLSRVSNHTVNRFVGREQFAAERFPRHFELILWMVVTSHPNPRIKRHAQQHVVAIQMNRHASLTECWN